MGDKMVSSGKGRLFRRKDGKYMLYIPVDLAEDSKFPFNKWKKTRRGTDAIPVKVSFDPAATDASPQLLIENWK
jgi:hypothetical protein